MAFWQQAHSAECFFFYLLIEILTPVLCWKANWGLELSRSLQTPENDPLNIYSLHMQPTNMTLSAGWKSSSFTWAWIPWICFWEDERVVVQKLESSGYFGVPAKSLIPRLSLIVLIAWSVVSKARYVATARRPDQTCCVLLIRRSKNQWSVCNNWTKQQCWCVWTGNRLPVHTHQL
jgi:hypothetical protein